jgi:solute carrier family 27 fatty acid transporter 1/4
MCRYLLSAPARPEDRAHSVRLMVGNGMRPQIWRNFVNRFKIEQVNEVYGSSEGNANIST